jgi:iron complex transport system ATP-binding protein
VLAESFAWSGLLVLKETTALLSASSLTASYGGPDSHSVLENVSIELHPGELTLLVGPNGSGKSTLLRSLSRTLKPKSGAVLLSGQNLYDVSARKAAQSISVVPQDTSIAFEFSVREVTAMGRTPYQPALSFGFSESAADSRAIESALSLVDIPEQYYSRSISSLSGGERQRVSIAKAIAQDTAAILLDEPSSSLDLRHTQELLSLLKSLAREKNRMVAAVLHDINLASAWGDRVIVMSDGKIAADGHPDDILNAQLIESVYGVNSWRRRDPVSGSMCLQILPIGKYRKRITGKRAHVICGGGDGAKIIWSLHEAGVEVSVGIVSEKDPEADLSRELGLELLLSAPHSILKMADKERIVNQNKDCDLLIVAGDQYGEANAINLEAASELARRGIQTVVDSKIQSCLENRSEYGTMEESIKSLKINPNVQFTLSPIEISLSLLENNEKS